MDGYSVYCHTNISNNKKYIGITRQIPSNRFRCGKGYKTQPYFCRAIQKYGWDNFSHEIIIDGLTKEEAEQMEIKLIKQYKTNNKQYGYNTENGGNCIGKISDETKKLMSISHSGKNNPFYGKKHTLETRELISCKIIGKVMSEEAKLKISKANKSRIVNKCSIDKMLKNRRSYIGKNNPMYGKTRTEEFKHNNMINQPNRKEVLQIDKDNNVIKIYDGIKQASRETGFDATSISRTCRGLQKQSGGYKWLYNN